MPRRPSPSSHRWLSAQVLIEDPIRILVLSGASRAKDLSFLIYTLKIRNRRNSRRISNLHFSNLYRSPALFFMFCSSISFESSSRPSAPLRWAPSCSSSSSSRASNASRGISPLPTREPRAKLQRTLIYGTGINFSRNSLKTKDRDHA